MSLIGPSAFPVICNGIDESAVAESADVDCAQLRGIRSEAEFALCRFFFPAAVIG